MKLDIHHIFCLFPFRCSRRGHCAGTLLTLIFLFSFGTSFAQEDHLSEKTDWIYQLEIAPPDPEVKKIYVPDLRGLHTLKIVNKGRWYEDYFLLGFRLKKVIDNGGLTIYQKNGMAIPTAESSSVLEKVETDTFFSYDPDTYEELIEVAINTERLFPRENTFYQFNQKWDFDSKKKQLKNSISYVDILRAEETFEDARFLFRIKNKDKKKKKSTKKIMKSNSIVWAAEVNINGTFKNRDLREKLLSKKHLTKHKVVDYPDANGVELNWEQIGDKMGGAVDTLLDYKVQEIEHEVSVLRNPPLTADDITKFKVIQDIYFDVKRNSFSSRIKAIAPLKDVVDTSSGNLLYTLPLFWIIYDDDYIQNN